MLLAARAEQEIRAYPRLHSAFYTLVTRNATLRAAAGRTKDRVREATIEHAPEPAPVEEPAVRELRERATAVRLGL